jgi:hypothetical protein
LFDIELVPFGSTEDIAQQARVRPESIQAYICNLGAHWFTIRIFGRQYFDLNSCYYVPKLLSSDMMLAEFLHLIQENDYSVFIVHGHLDPCPADKQLTDNPLGPAEDRSLTKDLPRMIMDGKTIGDPKDLAGHEILTVSVPQEFFDELRKNPKNPYIRKQIFDQIPEHFADDDTSDYKGCSDSTHLHLNRRVILRPMLTRQPNEKMKRHTNCSHNHHQTPASTERLPPKIPNNPLSDTTNEQRRGPHRMPGEMAQLVVSEQNPNNPYESRHESHIITTEVAQVLVRGPDPNNPNGPPRQRLMTAVRITGGPPVRDTASLNDHSLQQMSQPSLGFGDDDDFLKQAMAASLLDESEMDDDIDMSTFEKRLQEHDREILQKYNQLRKNDPELLQKYKQIQERERAFMEEYKREILQKCDQRVEKHHQELQKYEQELVDIAIAASLIGHDDSSNEQFEQTPKLNSSTTMNSSPTPTINSEPVVTKNPPSSTTSSSPPSLMNTHSSSPENTNSVPPTDTYPPPSTTTHTPSSMNTHSLPPTNIPSSPPKNTDSFSSIDTYSPPLTHTHASLPNDMNSLPATNASSPPPTTTYIPPLVVTEPDPVKSPSIEGKLFEIRLH